MESLCRFDRAEQERQPFDINKNTTLQEFLNNASGLNPYPDEASGGGIEYAGNILRPSMWPVMRSKPGYIHYIRTKNIYALGEINKNNITSIIKPRKVQAEIGDWSEEEIIDLLRRYRFYQLDPNMLDLFKTYLLSSRFKSKTL